MKNNGLKMTKISGSIISAKALDNQMFVNDTLYGAVEANTIIPNDTITIDLEKYNVEITKDEKTMTIKMNKK